VRISVVIFLLYSLIFLPSSNPILSLISLVFLPYLAATLWRPGEPSVFLVAMLFQWISITIKVFYGNIIGKEFDTLHEFPLNIQEAFFLSLYGLFFIVLGIAYFLRKTPSRREELDIEILHYDTKKVIIAYLAYLFFVGLLLKLRFIVPGLFQGIVALNKLKFGFIFFALFISFSKNELRLLAILAVSLEFFLGFLSFFSNFKEIIIIALITYVAFSEKVSGKLIFVSLIILIIGFRLGIIWTGIKGEYRAFLAGGERSQKVVVDKMAALKKIRELIVEYDGSQEEEIIRSLVDRVSYIDHFSASLAYVPEYVDHENGGIWWAAVTHMFTPRLFFPNKPAIDDSQHLMKYTGMVVADASMGTSISLGYMGDSYIDFGRNFMIVPIFLLGLTFGYVYRNLFLKTRKVVWAYMLIIPLYELSYNLGVTSVKMISELIMFFLTALLFRKFVIPRIDPLLKASRGSKNA
jgi:hypothetical protein